MSRRRKRRRRSSSTAKTVRRTVATGSTVTLATVGLSTCSQTVAVDPPPPPPLVCADANQGQNLAAVGTVQDTTLTVTLFSTKPVSVDTVYVSNVVGATLDSLDASAGLLEFTLDADTTTQVVFTVAGTFGLQEGPCDFTRTFTATIDNGKVDVAQRRIGLPLDTSRDVRVELVERDGLRVRLKATGADDRDAVWSVTAGSVERQSHDEIIWHLPPDPGFYQVQLFVDRGERGFGFDALSLQVS